jgi:hypothetical protein
VRHLVFCSPEKGAGEFYLLREGMDVPREANRYQVLQWPVYPDELCGLLSTGERLCTVGKDHEHWSDVLDAPLRREYIP